MTEIYLTFTVASIREPERQETAAFLVDTGATLAWVPQEMAQALGLAEEGTVRLELADGTITERAYGFCLFRYDGETMAANVVIGPPQCEALVGTHVLQDFRLRIDFDRHEVTRGGAMKAKLGAHVPLGPLVLRAQQLRCGASLSG